MSELQHVHFIAIGGTGMGSLAGLLKARGIEITGSDKALYPPMSTALERWQIPVSEGFSAEHVTGRAPDLVVIGNAVRRDNEEAAATIEAGLPYRSFSDALYELAIEATGRHSVVVSGTHGKTTTTNLIAALLLETGRDPSLLVGGISLDFDGSFREGQGEHFVVEGDEYDTAFFDKTPKFLHYHPQSLVLTSVEFDHADIYRDLDHVKSAFRELVSGMPADGTVVAAAACEGVADVVRSAACRVLRYGVAASAAQTPACDYLARELRAGAEGTGFVLDTPGGESLPAHTTMYGDYNVENAVAAIAMLDVLGVPCAESVAALPRVLGVKRRQEVRGEAAGVTVIDDFAHHPTAVAASIGAARARFPEQRLVAVFEPRTNTSRRKIFQDDYARAFDGAAEVLVREVPDEPIYSATGEVSELFSAGQLADALESRGIPTGVHPEVEGIVDHIVSTHGANDVVLVMSNGSFDDIWDKLLTALSESRR
jgi:UDP-N-acetylmuramate: L-alanyl-gamma-D-glutamyl-meso-diaminopimelate ligase